MARELTTIYCSFHPSRKVGDSWTLDENHAACAGLANMIAGFGPSLSPKNIVDFMNQDGNVLLSLSGKSATPSAVSSLLLELDLHLSSDRSSIVVDHFNYDTVSAAEKHDVLLLPRPGQLRPDTKAFFGGNGVLAFPRAVPQTLGNDNNLINPVLRAPVTSYSYNPKEGDAPAAEDITATGSQLALVSAMQARNSARFTVLGSVESLEDKWFLANVKTPTGQESKTVNREFAKQLTAWTFKETGVLKVGKVEHHLAESPVSELNPSLYRIKNETVRLLYPSFHPFLYLLLTDVFRSSTSKSPNTPIVNTFPLRFLPAMLSSLNSPCFLLSIASISSLSVAQKTAPSTVYALPFPISMASSRSA